MAMKIEGINIVGSIWTMAEHHFGCWNCSDRTHFSRMCKSDDRLVGVDISLPIRHESSKKIFKPDFSIQLTPKNGAVEDIDRARIGDRHGKTITTNKNLEINIDLYWWLRVANTHTHIKATGTND